jgi:hypothetical protein
MPKEFPMPQLKTIAAACLAAVVTVGNLLAADAPQFVEPPGGALAADRPRVIVSSDIGGSDPDDMQSFVHLLVYADVLDIEGLIASPPGDGRSKDIHAALDAYARDYPNLKTYASSYPTPQTLRELTKQGDEEPWTGDGGQPTEGSQWIINQAKRDDPRPLYVCVFGSITDVAQALRDDPSIEPKLRVYFIASWNQQQDKAAFAFVDKNHPNLWLIHSNTTFRGMYVGGDQTGDLGNATFPERHVRGHGALGDYFWAAMREIKMGDTPSVLYLLRGNLNDPTQESWGGRYVPRDGRPHWWIDDPDPTVSGPRGFAGSKSVSKWREHYLRDWQARMDRCLGPKED